MIVSESAAKNKILVIHSGLSTSEEHSWSRRYGKKLLDILQPSETRFRDLYQNPPMLMNELLAYYYPGKENDPRYSQSDKAILTLSNQLIDELFWAEQIIIESPMHNFAINSYLKAYLDLIIIKDKTFAGYQGLLTNRKIYFVCSRGGGEYEIRQKNAEYNFQTPYLKRIAQMIGFSPENMQFLFIDKINSQVDHSHADKILDTLSQV